MKRRDLLQQLAIAGAALAPASSHSATDRLGPVLPLRTLGETGEKVTSLGLGGYHIGWPESEKQVQATIEAAMENGMRTLRMDAVEKIFRGLTDLDEVLRVC